MIRDALYIALGAAIWWDVSWACYVVKVWGLERACAWVFIAALSLALTWFTGAVFGGSMPTWPTPRAEGRKETR